MHKGFTTDVRMYEFQQIGAHSTFYFSLPLVVHYLHQMSDSTNGSSYETFLEDKANVCWKINRLSAQNCQK